MSVYKVATVDAPKIVAQVFLKPGQYFCYYQRAAVCKKYFAIVAHGLYPNNLL